MICRAFWSGAAANAVVVEADAFKETDVIYRAISSRGHHNDMLQTAELVFLNMFAIIKEISLTFFYKKMYNLATLQILMLETSNKKQTYNLMCTFQTY